MVQTIKNILEKCHEEGGDPYLGVLSYRATPVDHHLKSPAELLTHRKFKTLLPMPHRQNLTADSVQVKEQLQRQQDQYSFYYNRNAGPTLKPIHPGQPVRILDQHTKTWEPGTVVKKAKEPRSYMVKNTQTEGVYRRTITHLRPYHVTHQEPSRSSGPTASGITTEPYGKAIGEAQCPAQLIKPLCLMRNPADMSPDLDVQ